MTTAGTPDAHAVDQTMFREYDIRGFVDQNFTEPVLGRLGGALGTFLAGDGEPGTVAVGRDVRLSSQRYAATFIEGLRNTGARVIDVGQVPTPLLYYAVNTLHTNGGGCITASHNPPQFNGLKARKREAGLPNGVPLRPSDIQDLFRLAQGGTFRKAAAGAHDHHDVVDDYVRYVATQIKLARPLKVVVDAGNGVAGPVAIQTFTALGCEVIPLYCEPDGTFPNHMPDPLKPENLRDLIAKVKETKADMGIALDGDGDRLGVVDDAGEILWADQYLVILARNALRTHPGGSVVFDVKCSQGLIDGITAAGGVPVMSRTGYPNIMSRRRETNAILAGELSGHTFFGDPVIDFDDGTFAGANLLAALSREPVSLSHLVADLPRYHATPEERFYCADDAKFAVIDALKEAFAHDASVHEVISLDGARVVLDGGWGLVRASNTEPAITTRFEGVTPERAQAIRTSFMDRLAHIPAVDLHRSAGH